MLLESQDKREFVTGLVYFNEARGNIQDVLNLDEIPLIEMPESRLRPSKELLEALMSSMA